MNINFQDKQQLMEVIAWQLIDDGIRMVTYLHFSCYSRFTFRCWNTYSNVLCRWSKNNRKINKFCFKLVKITNEARKMLQKMHSDDELSRFCILICFGISVIVRKLSIIIHRLDDWRYASSKNISKQHASITQILIV